MNAYDKWFSSTKRYTFTNIVIEIVDSGHDLLIAYNSLFVKRGYQKLNQKSISLLANISAQCKNGLVYGEQAIEIFAKWLCYVLTREPGYILVIKEAIGKEYPTDLVGDTDNKFVNQFIDGFHYDSATKLLKRIQEEMPLSPKATTKAPNTTIQNPYFDYLTTRQRASDSVQSTKGPQKAFTSLLSLNQIRILHSELIKHSFISTDTPLEHFEVVFSGTKTTLPTPINWLSKTNSLGHLFYILDYQEQLISGKWQDALGNQVKAFFKNGRLITTTNYSSIVSNARSSNNKGKLNKEQVKISSIVAFVISSARINV